MKNRLTLLPAQNSPLGFFPMSIQKLWATATIAMASTSSSHLDAQGEKPNTWLSKLRKKSNKNVTKGQ